jgi:hypothetical protein
MIRILIFILAFGFAAQSSGATSFIKKTVGQTEQAPDDAPKGEEKGDTEGKKEQDKMGSHYYFQGIYVSVQQYQSEYKHYYSSGFYSIPYLPPRKTAF